MLCFPLGFAVAVFGRELKKMRTQRRQAREKEKQELIRCVPTLTLSRAMFSRARLMVNFRVAAVIHMNVPRLGIIASHISRAFVRQSNQCACAMSPNFHTEVFYFDINLFQLL
jgi:hypothetical protein